MKKIGCVNHDCERCQAQAENPYNALIHMAEAERVRRKDMTQREQFEAWAKYHGYPLGIEADGETHKDPRTHAAWAAWQAQTAAEPVTKFKLLTITTAYEQGVGKGIKRNDFNPYVEGIVEWDAWRLGYEEGLTKTAVADLPAPVVLRSTGGHLQGVNDDMDAEVIARYVACGWTPLYTSQPDHTAAMRLALDVMARYQRKRDDWDTFAEAIAALEKELK